jgi:hypothetical protein
MKLITKQHNTRVFSFPKQTRVSSSSFYHHHHRQGFTSLSFLCFFFFFIIFSRVASKTNCGCDFFVAAHGDGFGGGDFL